MFNRSPSWHLSRIPTLTYQFWGILDRFPTTFWLWSLRGLRQLFPLIKLVFCKLKPPEIGSANIHFPLSFSGFPFWISFLGLRLLHHSSAPCSTVEGNSGRAVWKLAVSLLTVLISLKFTWVLVGFLSNLFLELISLSKFLLESLPSFLCWEGSSAARFCFLKQYLLSLTGDLPLRKKSCKVLFQS